MHYPNNQKFYMKKNIAPLILVFVIGFALTTFANANNFWIAELDAETTRIANTDPLARSKLRKLIEARQSKGQFNETTYRPLRQLGLILQREGSHEESIEIFRQLQHLVHRNYGVYSPMQLESLDFLIESYAKLGDFKATDAQQHFYHRVSTSSFEPEELDYIIANLKLADWYRNTMRFNDALELYEESIKTIDKKSDKLRIRTLRAIALTKYLAGNCCAEEEVEQALTVLVNSDTADKTDRNNALTDYIDATYLVTNRNKSPALKHAQLRRDLEPALLGFHDPAAFFDSLSTTKKLNKTNVETLYIQSPQPDFTLGRGGADNKLTSVVSVGKPIAICNGTYTDLVKNNEQALTFDVTVSVNSEGNAENISIDGKAPVKLVRYIRKALKKSRFRPAINDKGEPSDGSISFRQTFSPNSSNELAFTSSTEVSRWSSLLIAQSCHLMNIASL